MRRYPAGMRFEFKMLATGTLGTKGPQRFAWIDFCWKDGSSVFSLLILTPGQ